MRLPKVTDMLQFSARARHRRAFLLGVHGAIAAVLVARLVAIAQEPTQPLPLWAQPKGAPPSKAAPQQPSGQPSSPVIARVEGRDITQADFDRIALPYFRQVRAQLGSGFTGEIQKLANQNVLEELIRRELLAVEAQRQKITVTQDEVDALLMQDPFFLTNGEFDSPRFNAFKSNPASNYRQMLPRLRETTATNKLYQSLRKRFTPTPAQVRAEWSKRNDQVRLMVLPLLTRDQSTEPEATEADWARYYAAHPDQFMRRTRVRLNYLRLPLPAAGDTIRAVAEAKGLARAQSVADSLRGGALADSAAELTRSGLFEIPTSFIPGLGPVAGLTDTLGRDSTARVVGPYLARDAVIVGIVAERQPAHVPPMREVIGDVKRRADAEKRRLANESERRAFFEAHRDHWRGTRAAITRITLSASTIAVEAPAPPEIDAWYARHGRSLLGVADSARSGLPPLSDSLRAVVRARVIEEGRARRATAAIEKLAAAMRTARDVRALARAEAAAAETLTLSRDSGPDSLFQRSFVDSLLASASAQKGVVQGPRTFGTHEAVWRIDAADTSFVPTYDAARARADLEFMAERGKKEEAEARAYFDQHRAEYKTPIQYALDYVAVPIPPPDSVRIAEAAVRRRYDADPNLFAVEEQVRARHILIAPRGSEPDADRKAKARADSLLAVIRKGGVDFAALAKSASQEPGAAASGGDLSWFGRTRMVKPFSDAAFALKVGEISPVIKTQFGYHIIKAEDRRPAGRRPFAEVRDELRRQMAQARADSLARRAATALRARLVIGDPANVLAAAGRKLVAAAPISAREALPEIGFAPELGQDLPSMARGKWAPKAYRTRENYLVIRLREVVPPHAAEFADVMRQAIDDSKNAQRREIVNQKVATVRAALAAGASLDSLAVPFGGLRDTGFLSQSAGFVPEVGTEPRLLEKAFAMKPGTTTDSLQVAGGVVWMRLEEKKSGDPATFRAAAALLEAEMMKQRYGAWAEEKKKTVRIEILRPDLKEPPSSPLGTATMSTAR